MKERNISLYNCRNKINHNGDMKIAKELIDVASDAGADAVKFQRNFGPSYLKNS